MKYKNWEEFKINCSCISKLLPQPIGFKALKVQENKKYHSLLLKEVLTEDEANDFAYLDNKYKLHLKPTDLCVGAKSYLIEVYGKEKYGVRRASLNGTIRSTALKGFVLEKDGIDLISKIDGIDYKKEVGIVSDNYFKGVCDILCPSGENIIDIKTSWNIANFMKVKKDNYILPVDMWAQMQGYLHLYNIKKGQVCFVLVNTPPHLIEQEYSNLFKRYSYGEITREKYDEENYKLDSFFDYTKIPDKKRVIKFDIEYSKEFIELVKNKVDMSRAWLKSFDKSFMSTKNIKTYSEMYMKVQEEIIEP
jgi:hypothetical protein